ncbi:MAG: hypothetical protein ACK5PS_15780 [Desulfopila sp.]
MKKQLVVLLVVLVLQSYGVAGAAYHHGSDTDSDTVLMVFPSLQGSKLDSCALCHTGGQYEKGADSWVSLGSCQWCHLTYGYDGSGNIADTLNSYGQDYLSSGRSAAALAAVDDRDSDGDGFTNKVEIAALRFPGNPADDPSRVPAPYRVYTRAELIQRLPYHQQTMLLNSHKSDDFYGQYGGVVLADLLDDSQILDSATGITVYAPDGWAQYHR